VHVEFRFGSARTQARAASPARTHGRPEIGPAGAIGQSRVSPASMVKLSPVIARAAVEAR